MITSDLSQYVRAMAEALATMHWVGEIDGNDIEFVLAPPYKDPLKWSIMPLETIRYGF